MFKKLLRIFFQTAGNPWAPLPVRLAVGTIFLAHGSQKLFGAFGGPGLHMTAEFFAKGGLVPGLFWATLAGCGEFFGGLLVFLGLLTRFGAFNIAVVMSVAILHVHLKGGFFAPKGIEYPLALLGAAVSLMISGAGRLSCDKAIESLIRFGPKRP